MSLTLGKKHKLCSKTSIDRLFADGSAHRRPNALLAFPLRALWQQTPQRPQGDPPMKFLISVPKRRLRHAVDRVLMRRRIREAYRLLIPRQNLESSTPLDIAFIYVADQPLPYASVEKAMARILRKLPGAQ